MRSIYKNSISVVQKVKINGNDQYIFISSNDISNPLLLVLYGGQVIPAFR